MRCGPLLLCGLLLAVGAWGAETAHPYLLWTREEAAAIRQRIETEPWAKAAYEQLLAERGWGEPFRNLFRYLVMGDQKAGENEKRYLLGIIGTHPRNFEKLEHGGRHYDCYIDALRYDAVYDLLSAEQRQQIEATFRVYIEYQLADKKLYTRLSWLPNMQWPRPMAAHQMALALGDEKVIRTLINSNGGWKWYFDQYIADGQFYMEEFGKHASMIGQMLLFCRGLERLGLDELGYGYTGQGGATMRRYLESILSIGWPRTDWGGGMPRYSKLTMGDSKGGGAAPHFAQHGIIEGCLPGGTVANRYWSALNMNGRDHRNAKVPKLGLPQWFEIAHAKWPDARFDYFLAQLRQPGQNSYVPTLFWGVAPIAADKVQPPPAPSYIAPERGFAMLRAEQSPAYWESPAPAVALQFASLYVHYVADCFSLLGYHAFNRPIYVNRAISAGYNGGPYDFHVRAHCGVVVDGLQAQPIGPVPVRHQFGPLVKYVAAHAPILENPFYKARGEVRSSDDPHQAATAVYPGVELRRALLLTREYLFDVFQLNSQQPHRYHWLVHPLGQADPEDPRLWTVSEELQQTLFAVPEIKIGEARHRLVGDADWALTTRQARHGTTTNRLGEAWFARQVGVRVHMLGEPGTTVWFYQPPLAYLSGPRAHQPGKAPKDFDETGGVSLAVARQATNTMYVALHVPFETNQPPVRQFARIAQTDAAVAARVDGQQFSHRLLWAASDTQPVTLAGQGESFTFRGHGFVRVRSTVVEVEGPVTALRVRVVGQPILRLNGQPVVAQCAAGWLTWPQPATNPSQSNP